MIVYFARLENLVLYFSFEEYIYINTAQTKSNNDSLINMITSWDTSTDTLLNVSPRYYFQLQTWKQFPYFIDKNMTPSSRRSTTDLISLEMQYFFHVSGTKPNYTFCYEGISLFSALNVHHLVKTQILLTRKICISGDKVFWENKQLKSVSAQDLMW